MGVRSLTSSSLVWGYLGLVLSGQASLARWNVHEKSKGGKTVSSALKPLNTSKHSLFHFLRKTITLNAFNLFHD